MNKKLAGSLKSSIPWLLAGIGIVVIGLGEVLNFTESTKPLILYSKEKLNGFFIEAGKAIVISGVASITLNSLKYLGIYSEELTKLLFDTKFLKNRKDLVSYWFKVTKELLNDKFPKITDLVLRDVHEIYLPTSSIRYYESFWQHTNIILTDPILEMVEIIQTTRFIVIAVSKNTEDKQRVTSSICNGGNSASASFSLLSCTINGETASPQVEERLENNLLNSDFELTLTGSETYNVEIKIKKTYSLQNDCVIGYRHQNITHNSTLNFQLDGVTLDFNPLGTLNNFNTKTQNDTLIVKEYVGLLYKNQGYTAHIRKK